MTQFNQERIDNGSLFIVSAYLSIYYSSKYVVKY